jgi:hypothetical protein
MLNVYIAPDDDKQLFIQLKVYRTFALNLL